MYIYTCSMGLFFQLNVYLMVLVVELCRYMYKYTVNDGTGENPVIFDSSKLD